MPVNGRELMADFISSSGHKSWAAGGGNVGLLSISESWGEKVFKASGKYKVKPLEILGCSSRGSSTIALIASFQHVKERVKNWGSEVENARYVVSELEKIGLVKIGVKPTQHDVNFFESEVLYKISQTHKDKNFFLYNELKKRGIVGIKAGLTKNFKMSTYGKTKEQLKHLIWAFQDTVEKCK